MSDGPGFAARTDAGLVRSGNEDRFLARSPVFAVADGMGGHLAGEVASQLAIDAVGATIETTPAPDEAGLVDALERSNAAIRGEARDHPELDGMGTTCTVVTIGDVVRIAHVGDSRAYRFRDGRLEQLTQDHSLVASLVRDGVIDAARARTDARRNIVTRALGAEDEVRVDRVETDRLAGDRLILCTDGLHGQVDDAAIVAVLAAAATPADAADRLVGLANMAGGDDNVTVIVIDVDRLMPDEEGAADMSADPTLSSAGHRRGRHRLPMAILVVAVALLAIVIVAGVLALGAIH